MEQNSFFGEIKKAYNSGEMHIRLIFINAMVFVTIGLLTLVDRLMGANPIFHSLLTAFFALQTNLLSFLSQPWGIFTSMFAHFGLWHFIMNMLFLFFSGQMFLVYFSGKRLLSTYILGGIFGGLLEIIMHLIFPSLQSGASVVVGASGSIMAIFIALAFYRPQLEVKLFGVFTVKLFLVALLFLLSDLFAIGTNDGTAHFAHLGGAFLGFLSVRNLNYSKNIVTLFSNFLDRMKVICSKFYAPKKMKVVKTDRRNEYKSDEHYALNKRLNQEKIDAILDKISKAGYETLSKSEKDFLFKQSRK